MFGRKNKTKELIDIVDIIEEEFNKLDFKGKQKYFKAKSKLCTVAFSSRDENGKGKTYIKPKMEEKR